MDTVDPAIVGALLGVIVVTVINIIGWFINSLRQTKESAKQQGAFEEKVSGIVHSVDELKEEMTGAKKQMSTCSSSIATLQVQVDDLRTIVLNGGRKGGRRK